MRKKPHVAWAPVALEYEFGRLRFQSSYPSALHLMTHLSGRTSTGRYWMGTGPRLSRKEPTVLAGKNWPSVGEEELPRGPGFYSHASAAAQLGGIRNWLSNCKPRAKLFRARGLADHRMSCHQTRGRARSCKRGKRHTAIFGRGAELDNTLSIFSWFLVYSRVCTEKRRRFCWKSTTSPCDLQPNVYMRGREKDVWAASPSCHDPHPAYLLQHRESLRRNFRQRSAQACHTREAKNCLCCGGIAAGSTASTKGTPDDDWRRVAHIAQTGM